MLLTKDISLLAYMMIETRLGKLDLIHIVSLKYSDVIEDYFQSYHSFKPLSQIISYNSMFGSKKRDYYGEAMTEISEILKEMKNPEFYLASENTTARNITSTLKWINENDAIFNQDIIQKLSTKKIGNLLLSNFYRWNDIKHLLKKQGIKDTLELDNNVDLFKKIALEIKNKEPDILYKLSEEHDKLLRELKIVKGLIENDAISQIEVDKRIEKLIARVDTEFPFLSDNSINTRDKYLKATGIESAILDLIDIEKKINQSMIANREINVLYAQEFMNAYNQYENKDLSDKQMDSITGKLGDVKFIRDGFSDKGGILLFRDNSMVIRSTDNNFSMVTSSYELGQFITTLFLKEINANLENRPFIAKSFGKLLKDNPENYDYFKMILDNFLKAEAILKAEGFNIVDFIEEEGKKGIVSFEKVDDKIAAIIEFNNLKKYAHSISNKKYRHLYNDESYAIFRELKENNVSEQQLQDLIGRKMAAYQSSEMFNEALKATLNTFLGFDRNIISKKVRDLNATILSEDNNKLVIKIDNYEQSKALGSSSWCIVREELYFNTYTRSGQSQYFIYDFNKASYDNNCMIGVTFDREGEIYAAHSKDDTALTKEQKQQLKEEMSYIINADIKIKSKIENKL